MENETSLCYLGSAPGAGSPNRRPVAFVGPDKNLFLPLSSLLLDGSGSTDDHVIVSFHWDMIRYIIFFFFLYF